MNKIDGKLMMTGQEWYDRFEKIFNDREQTIHNDLDYYLDGMVDEEEVLRAAKVAAGIE